MSIRGRVSKTKKYLFKAKETIIRFDKWMFTNQGKRILERVQGDIDKNIGLLDDLKDEIENKRRD